MPQIDFYILPTRQTEQILRFVAKLSEKAYQSANAIFIYTDDGQQAKQLDDILWEFSAESFVPHQLCQIKPLSEQNAVPDTAMAQISSRPPSIQISHDPNACSQQQSTDVLINLADNIPDAFAKFTRVVEIVSDIQTQRDIARQHFKFYRQHGFTPNSHDIKSTVLT